MTTEVFWSKLPRESRGPIDLPHRRGLILIEAYDEGDAGVAMLEIPPQVLDSLTTLARLSGHGLLAEILQRLTCPRPVVWGGRNVR